MHTVYILLPLSLEHYILIETQRRELIGGFFLSQWLLLYLCLLIIRRGDKECLYAEGVTVDVSCSAAEAETISVPGFAHQNSNRICAAAHGLRAQGEGATFAPAGTAADPALPRSHTPVAQGRGARA